MNEAPHRGPHSSLAVEPAPSALVPCTAVEFAAKLQPSEGLSRRGRLRARARGRADGLQRDAVPAAARGARSGRGGAERRQPLPGPVEHAAAPGAERPLRRPGQPDRDRQRLVRHPARRRATRCSSRAPRSSTRGRPSRVYPHLAAASGARAIEVPVDAEHKHDLEAMLREITVATRLVIVCNPNNPTSTALPLDDIAAFVAERPAPRRGDPRRGLLRVQPARRPRRVGRAARPAPEPRAAADVLEGLRAVRPAGRLRAVRVERVPRRRRRRPPALLLQRRRPGRRDRRARLAGRDRRARGDQPRRAPRRSTEGLRRLGIAAAESQANFVWFDLPGRGGRRRRRDRARRSATSSCAPARRSAARVRCGSPSAPPRTTSASSPRSASWSD